MHCPYCGHNDSRVIDSREAADGIRRRRECFQCGLRFTTYERVQTTALLVAKRDGRREEFNSSKLLHSIRLACAKRPLATGAIDKVVAEIESTLQGLGKAEILSSTIGEMVVQHLKMLDRVAYIRFASVYRDFADIETFREETRADRGKWSKKESSPKTLPGRKAATLSHPFLLGIEISASPSRTIYNEVSSPPSVTAMSPASNR